MRSFITNCLFLIGLISFAACSKVESDSQKTDIESINTIDSMPIIKPELPETSNIVKPQSKDSMPTAHPESIDIQ